MPRRVHIVPFGCQMNKLDAELTAAALRAAGHAVVGSVEEADTVLYHTCAVRDQAENRVLSHIGMLKDRRAREPGFRIGVLGCMAQRLGAALQRKAPAVDLVVGSRQFHRIAEWLDAADAGPVVAVEETDLDRGRALPPHGHAGGPQAWVSAMRGCDNYCAYCIVPYVRGRETSRRRSDIVDEVRRLVDAGAAEVTLLGQSIDRWGRDLDPPQRLPDLLEAVGGVAGLRRLRFVTAHPRGVDGALFRAMRDVGPVCEHLHAPAQSGDDAVLRAMNRGYDRAHYDRLVALGRETVPGLALASDFIVGFPGESEAAFARTLDLVESVRFGQIFAFRYSPRPGTAAAKLRDDVPHEEKDRRLQALLAAQERIGRERNEALVGADADVLVEGASKQDATKLAGRTRANALVMIPADPARRPGDAVRVRITGCTALTLFGEPVAE